MTSDDRGLPGAPCEAGTLSPAATRSPFPEDASCSRWPSHAPPSLQGISVVSLGRTLAPLADQPSLPSALQTQDWIFPVRAFCQVAEERNRQGSWQE